IGAMVWFEGLNPWDALWLTMTTMTTVGYGDMSAATVPGRLATILLMYVFGIFLLAQIAGEWIDYRMDRRERMRLGLWRWQMKNHILIVNTPETDGIRYLQGLVQQIRLSTSLEDYPIQIFSPNFPDGLPAELSSMGVVLHKGQPEGEDDMEAADADKADFIIVMAVDNHDVRSDSVTLDVLDRLSRLDLQGHVIAECVHDHNRERFRRHGANAVIRPVRAYPELMVRAMAAPGTETILEDLFTHDGAHPRRYNLEVPEQSWG
ncbi:MAG: two pore domain potassium channel family protein, partial [Pseudomonadales bacterium]|nr:two pore domain potassium channel family protein [Pseudomonadales bacterium]